jgi:hypothetical protein
VPNGSHNFLGHPGLLNAPAGGVKPCLRVECKFWLGNDGWNCISEQPAIAVQAGTFEQAKSDMEIALGKYIESLLGEGRARSEHAA